MHFLRQGLSIVAIILLPVFLFLFGLLFSLYQVFGSPTSLKEAVEQSGAYDTVVGDALNSVPGEENEEQREGVPLDDPDVQQVIQNAMPPEFLEEQATVFLDATYAWVRGDARVLEFTLDLREAKTDLISGLSALATERAATLPVCADTPTTLEADPLEVLNTECLPPWFDRATIEEQVRGELESTEFLEDPVVTASDIGGESKTPEQQLQGLRNAYNVLLAAVYVTGIGSLTLIAAAWLLAPKWRTGLRRVGVTAITVGAVSAVMAWLGAFMVKNVASGLAEEKVQATFADVLGLLAADVRSWWLIYSAILIVLGIAALIALKLTKPENEPEPTEPSEPEKAKPKKSPAILHPRHLNANAVRAE